MHPSFGIEFTCSSTKWEDVMKGPSREAVLAHTYKVLHYRSLFGSGEVARHKCRHPAVPPGGHARWRRRASLDAPGSMRAARKAAGRDLLSPAVSDDGQEESP